MSAEVVDNCWKKIGVAGDRSCSLLESVIHCRNCSVYAAAGRALLHREAPSGYVEEWTSLLTQTIGTSTAIEGNRHSTNTTNSIPSVLIFRLEEEWFALPVWAIKEVTSLCPIHTLPHRSNDILLGVVNIRGEILICISLANILGIKSSVWKLHHKGAKNGVNSVLYQRMVVMEIQDNRWVFGVDEIYSIQRIQESELVEAPTVITKTPDTYTKKIINWQDKKISFINHELLFYELLFSTISRP
jgi:chemotaxis-related protein WspD